MIVSTKRAKVRQPPGEYLPGFDYFWHDILHQLRQDNGKRLDNGARIGLIGVALLLISYVRLFGFRFMSDEWSIAILILSALAVIAFAMAGQLSSKWWYCGTLFGILSAFFVFAFSWG